MDQQTETTMIAPETAQSIAEKLKALMKGGFDMRSSTAVAVVTLAEQLANKVLNPGHLTVDDAMRAAHPAAGTILDNTECALDTIAQCVRADKAGKPGMMEAIAEALTVYGYKLDEPEPDGGS